MEVRAVRDAEQERKRVIESTRRPKPPVERGHSNTLYTDDDARLFRHASGQSSPLRFEQDLDATGDGQRSELMRRHTDGDYDNITRGRPLGRSTLLHVDDDLAYGELPPPPLPLRPYDDGSELRGKMSKLTMLLDEFNCLQHSATAIITNLQKNPEALAAVALTLAEISNLCAKLAPGALVALKGSFPAVMALLASPHFLIAAGVGVGVTIVALGGYKIIKRVNAKRDKDSQLEMDELQEISSDISRIETWRRGIAEAGPASSGTSVDGEFITPHASRQLLDAGVLSEHDLTSSRSSRRGSKSEKASKSKSSSKSSNASKGEEKPKKKNKKKEPSGLRMLFRKDQTL